MNPCTHIHIYVSQKGKKRTGGNVLRFQFFKKKQNKTKSPKILNNNLKSIIMIAAECMGPANGTQLNISPFPHFPEN